MCRNLSTKSMPSAVSLSSRSCATRSSNACFLSSASIFFIVSTPKASTSPPFFAAFHALYAANVAPIAAQDSAVSTFSFGFTIEMSVLNFADHEGFIAAFKSSSALPVMRAMGYAAISSVLPVRFSALIVSMSAVCTSSFAALSGEKEASSARTK